MHSHKLLGCSMEKPSHGCFSKVKKTAMLQMQNRQFQRKDHRFLMAFWISQKTPILENKDIKRVLHSLSDMSAMRHTLTIHI